ncbi:MAG: chemotaxis protein CheW [Pseudomonadota bacterium]
MNDAATPATAPPDVIVEEETVNTLLTFELGGEVFAINVMRVQEILDIVSMTPVPHANRFAPGVINVRGNVVPVIDLRYRFGMPPRDQGKSTRTVVFEVRVEGETTRVAMAVDAVYNVEPVQELTIEELPESGSKWNGKLITGIARIRERLTIILNLENVFDTSVESTKPLIA